MITCRELVDFVIGYLDGTLSPEESAVFEEHLRVCPPCVDYLNTYRQTIRLGKAACCGEPAQKPPEMPEALVKAILAARRSAPQ